MFVTIFAIDKDKNIVYSKDAGNYWSKLDYKTNKIQFTHNIERFKVEKFDGVPLILVYLRDLNYYFRLFDGKQKWVKFDPEITSNKEKLDKKLLEKLEEMIKYFYPLESHMTKNDVLENFKFNKDIDNNSINLYTISDVFKYSDKDNRLAIDFNNKLYILDRYEQPTKNRVNYWRKLNENNLRHSTTFQYNNTKYKQKFQIFQSDKEFNINTIGYNKNENLTHLKFMIDNIDKLKYKIPLVPSDTLPYNLDSWGYSTKYQLSKEISNSFCNYLRMKGYQDFYDDKCSVTKIKYKYNETSKKCMYPGVLNWKINGENMLTGSRKTFLTLKNDSDKSGCLETEMWSEIKYDDWIRRGAPIDYHWSNRCKRSLNSYSSLFKEDCQDKCNKNKDCKVYSYNNNLNRCVLHTNCPKNYQDFSSIDLTLDSNDEGGPAPNHGWKYYKLQNEKNILTPYRILQDEIYQKELVIKKELEGKNKIVEEYNKSSREKELKNFKNINLEREKK